MAANSRTPRKCGEIRPVIPARRQSGTVKALAIGKYVHFFFLKKIYKPFNSLFCFVVFRVKLWFLGKFWVFEMGLCFCVREGRGGIGGWGLGRVWACE